jgi:hypothetical protein
MSALEVSEMSVGNVASDASVEPAKNGAAELLAQSGGVQKPSELLNGEPSFSPEKEGASVQKVDPFLNEQARVKKRGVDAPREVHGALAVAPPPEAPTIPALVPLGTGGRPKVLTPELVEKLYMLLSVGFSRRQAAAYLGISAGTICTAAGKNPEFAAELRRAEELTALQSEMTLMSAARQNWRAAAWYLTYKAKNPPPLSEEEKEERHQARLADERRNAELRTLDWVNMDASMRAVSKAASAASVAEAMEGFVSKRTKKTKAK